MTKCKTISKGIIKRGNSYTFTVALGRDEKGKQIRKTTTFKAPASYSEKKANQMAIQQYEIFKNKCKDTTLWYENMYFKDLIEEYFEIYAKHTLKPITIYNYRKIVDTYLIPFLGNKKLKEIAPILLTKYFHTHMQEQCLKITSIKNIFTVLQSIFSYGLKKQYINESPCTKVYLSFCSNKNTNSRKYLKEEELHEFMQLFNSNSNFHTIIKFLLYTGMRSGECLGLMWEDIDFENKTITIQRTLSEIGGTFYLTPPKTKHSTRQIAMSDTIINLLKDHKIKQERIQSEIGEIFLHPEMVFTSSNGNYKSRNCLNRSLKRYLKNTKFAFMTLHCLRHTNATLLLNNGVDIKIVSDHLGHSNIGVTANVYANVYTSSRIKTAMIIDDKLAV